MADKKGNDIDAKAQAAGVEEAKMPTNDGMPEILRSYSSAELQAMEKSLVRKVDLRSLPVLIVLFILNILDRNAIANARLGGLEKTLAIGDVQYQTAIMVLWAGYISMMIPSNMLLSIFKPRIYLPTVVIVWGVVSGASGFVQNFAGLVVVRFLVGVVEAPYFPGCIFLLSSWYTKTELPSRIAIFYSGYTLSSAFGGLIAAGIIGGMDGAGGYPAWRWVFIIEGAITIVAAFAGYLLLPNYPENTPWLNETESALAQYRLSREVDGEVDEVTESVLVGLKQCLSDPKAWLLVLILSGAVVSMSFTYFFPSIVQTLGYPDVETLLLTAPPYFFACIFSITNSWHSGRTQERCFHIVAGCILSVVGQILSMSTYNTGARYFAMFLQAAGSFSVFQIILSWISTTIPRPKAKRAVALALCTAISNATNMSTAYLYPRSDAPLYRMGCIVIAVALVVCAASSLTLRFWLRKENKKLDRDEDGELRSFRYVL
ncbi:retrograde regulation protein 2 [Durotheca rogersii]|uniref:retrograde regulation protein 2 n=1 Tax=Durotheca rogersii TaxID=419775 RepID=UPI0022206F64|nr:retrograde regulation protein 2 [Durotheca rogersii]KAI5868110.1 retrograde regulation protein 2 [Durotheca rogersii]